MLTECVPWINYQRRFDIALDYTSSTVTRAAAPENIGWLSIFLNGDLPNCSIPWVTALDITTDGWNVF